MKRKSGRKRSFAVVLGISILLVETVSGVKSLTSLLKGENYAEGEGITYQDESRKFADKETEEKTEIEESLSEQQSTSQESETQPTGESRQENETQPTEEITTVPETEPVSKEETKQEIPAGNALFIGDSRTEGLEEYANLGDADFFAESGMSVYKVFDVADKVGSMGKLSLAELLSKKQYAKIYVMLGINELGYNFNKTVLKYEEVVLKLKELQPDAVIILEANLHVTGEKSRGDDVFNTENIERFNQSVKKIAQDTGCRFIDVNKLFDDSEGNLGAGYTFDGVHVLGKYYQDWADWILAQ